MNPVSTRMINKPHKTNSCFDSIVTSDRRMLSIFRYIEAVAPTAQAVMVTGETGTGKELIARAIHSASGRAGDFVSINVAGLDDIMFSDTLFGHERGSYTGAHKERKGLIEKATNGTLFLDEIGDLNNASQVKLLRLLQEGEYYSLGSDIVKISNSRIIVATNCALEEKMRLGEFRNDLYYRLCAHHIHLPPLRERRNDISLLTEYFTHESARDFGKKVEPTPPETLIQLRSYPFPGNIRELKGIISNAMAVSATGAIYLPEITIPHAESKPQRSSAPSGECFPELLEIHGRLPTLQEATDYLIREALRTSGGNRTTAANKLGISRQALNKRLQREPLYLSNSKGNPDE